MVLKIWQRGAVESSYLILNHSLKVRPIKFAKFDKWKEEELSRDCKTTVWKIVSLLPSSREIHCAVYLNTNLLVWESREPRTSFYLLKKI